MFNSRKKILNIINIFIFKLVYKILSILYWNKDYILYIESKTSKSFNNVNYIISLLKANNKVCVIKDVFSITNAHIMAKAKIILIDQSKNVLSRIEKSKKTKVIQLWHSGGWYKKVGFDAPRNGYNVEKEKKRIQRIHGNTDYMIISDKKLIPLYANAFRLKQENVLPFGLARTDSLLSRNKSEDLNYIYLLYPELKNKHLCLYAPTWRFDKSNNMRTQPKGPDINLLLKETKDEWRFLWRAHPSIFNKNIPDCWVDVSNIPQEVCLSVSSILITDYSSILFDFSLLSKPIYLFVEDVNEYIRCERGLYVHPNELAPNAVAYTTQQLLYLIRSNINVSYMIKNKYMSSCDGKSSKRILEFIVSNI
ncbi:MAG: CDP-glycerol glycerophosphotransferase family protein [Lachnospiraceae bacterium]|nr:CDP-glycerol glycerophosphotransferase family protein [Lachnospiraceae bacterium]